jgi:hypothetical protein
MALKPVMGGPTEVLNDERIGHTAGTPVAGNIMFYWGVSGMLLIGKSVSIHPVQ